MAWFDTPAAPPGNRRVTDAMHAALNDWVEGTFRWQDWDLATESVRDKFAEILGVRSQDVASLGSVSEFMATVERSFPDAVVLMLADEFRSVLYPFLAEDRGEARLRLATREPGETRTDALLRSLEPGVDFLVASEVLASDGDRVDVAALIAAARQHRCRVVVDASQALGALAPPSPLPDAYLTHTYKWLLAPRGVTLAYIESDLRAALKPVAPGWKSTARPHGYYGGPYELPEEGRKLDSSPSWLTMVGCDAAFAEIRRLDLADVEAHTLSLADEVRCGLLERGYRPVGNGRPSHLVAVDGPTHGLVEAFDREGVRCAVGDGFLRVGLHYFNEMRDVQRLMAAIDSRS
nr:aminotransferase class V-fold PLP-dependent enzyme [Egicoccus sp.]